MDKNVRIKANIGEDKILNVNLKQNADLFEILSLTLKQSDAYKIHSSNYGVIVGRILANDAFGVPNAKVSVFVPLNSEDNNDVTLKNLYPYESTNDVNSDGVRYNLLPTYSDDPCYAQVGTFPSKRMVLDEDTVLEVYDKYYKYTATTNKAGDYMIFGVPTGTTTIHVDVDLSDIGILSQKPRDFIYKGYNINQFESPTKFKSGTTLSSLPQIFSQDETVTVYPFFSDENAAEAAITRKDINLQYTFEATCVFLGSIVTDTGSNSISHNCEPNERIGNMSQLTTSEGTIEMIRKTPFGNVEEKSIQGNQLINSDGVWCYQIPMNLDYVGMDEYGNIVPTNDPSKGIPTRSRVRFRISVTEAGYDSGSHHKAKYLVPNNPFTVPDDDNKPILSDETKKYFDLFYDFGTKTPDCCFRDLYWNCVYTVKNYIPRLQKKSKALDLAHTGIKGINHKAVGDKNQFPYNKLNASLKMSAWQLIRNFFGNGHNSIKSLFAELFGKNPSDWKVFMYYMAKYVEENDGVSLDFANDWVNGTLYFPLWFWRVRKKRKYKKNENVYSSEFCSCTMEMNRKKNRFFNTSTCELPYIISANTVTNTKDLVYNFTSISDDINLDRYAIWNQVKYGIIKEAKNKDNLSVYYYAAGESRDSDFVRLFSTDIVLLGSLVDNDLNGIPKISDSYPSTTCLIPPMLSSTFSDYEEKEGAGIEDKSSSEESEESKPSVTDSYSGETVTGMLWRYVDMDEILKILKIPLIFSNNDLEGVVQNLDILLFRRIKTGVLFGVSIDSRRNWFGNRLELYTMPKSYLNAQRLNELGVLLDMRPTDENLGNFGYDDGLITKHEINDEYIRQLFATLNMEPLIASDEYKNKITGYKMYPIRYTCPVNFDGLMSNFVSAATEGKSTDIVSYDYNAFRFGGYGQYKFNLHYKGKYYFPAYDNSFYFYFGLNQGNTAIDKFKSEFYQNCEKEKEPEPSLPFDYKVEVTQYPTKESPEQGSIRLKLTSRYDFFNRWTYSINGKAPVEIPNDYSTNSADTIISGLYPDIYTIQITLSYITLEYVLGSVTIKIDMTTTDN